MLTRVQNVTEQRQKKDKRTLDDFHEEKITAAGIVTEIYLF